MFTRTMSRGRIKLLLRGEDYRDWEFEQVFPRPFRCFYKWYKLEPEKRATPYTFAVYLTSVAVGLIGPLRKRHHSAIELKLRALFDKCGAKKHF